MLIVEYILCLKFITCLCYHCRFSIRNITVLLEHVLGQGGEQEHMMPPRYQGLVFQRGCGRGRGRGRGREDGPDPFSDTKVENIRGKMKNQEENEQPRQRNTDQVLEELLRTNQQMMRQGQLMMDMMQQVMGLQMDGRPEGEPQGDGGSRAGGGSRTYQLPHTPQCGQAGRPTMPHFMEEAELERESDPVADLVHLSLRALIRLTSWTIGSRG